MDIILSENVFDSKLESRSDSATNLFACLTPENMTDNGIQPTLKDSDPNDTNEPVNESETPTNVNVESTANEDEYSESNTKELVQSGTENEAQISSVSENNDFVPTIIDIRGACNDSSEKFGSEDNSQVENTIDGKVTSNGNENDPACIVENDDDADIFTISDHEESKDCDEACNKSVTDFNTNVVIKQEPLDDDNDCMLVDSDDISTCFTSEIEIKEERLNENNDNEVICIETTSKIPLPIPIKIEANFESDKEVPGSESTSTRETEEEEKGESDVSNSSTVFAHKSQSKTSSAAKLYSSAYKCHLCNTSFQEHELLNEHMKLHRNNSLIERYNKAYGKQRKSSKYICRTCGKRLSTGQSLSQHMMIHNNEKPHVCPICKKDFRHLSNFKMHVQKHKEEEEQRRKQCEKQKLYAKKHPLPLPKSADRSVARSADFGRLVGPLFVKESLLKKSPSSEISKPMISPKTEYRKPYELKYPKPARHDNAKENLIYYKKMTSSSSSSTTNSYEEKYSRARKFNDDIGDDVIPLKTFNNVENIVMNATKFIVKVDNLDPNLLKKKIKTPDISIDKSATSIHRSVSDRKRRIQFSPSSEDAKRLKLDQIENIIMDSGTSTSTATQNDAESNDADHDFDLPSHYYDDDDDVAAAAAAVSTQPAASFKQETLTDNELFELLNDDRDSKDNLDQTSAVKSNVLVASLSAESVAVAASPVTSTPHKSSNVIVLKCTSSPAKSAKSLPSPLSTPVIDDPTPISSVPETLLKNQSPKVNTPRRAEIATPSLVKTVDLTSDTPPKKPQEKVIHLIDDSDADEEEIRADKCDMYDDAFRNVALRRLNLIHKKASQNGGKVENKYLLGPLFWRKILRKARRNQLTKEPVMSLNEAKIACKRINALKYGRQDIRRTNDPAKLQHRAELKLQYILGRIKAMNDISHLNLAGPLFWKRTLKLAGIHDPNDLKQLLNDHRLTIDDVEFVAIKVTEPVSVESNVKSTTVSTSTAGMNGDVMVIDDEDSHNTDTAAAINSNANSTQMLAKNAPEEIPSSSLLLPSLSSEGVKSPVALTGSDFLENIVVRNNASQPITNGSHSSIVDSILNDDLLKPKISVESPAPSTTPILTKPDQLSSVQVLKTTPDSTKEPVRRTVAKAESLLYDSLTKPKVMTPCRANPTFDGAAQTKTTSFLLNTLPQEKPTPLTSAPIKRNAATIAGGVSNRSILTSSTIWPNNATRKIPSRAPTSIRDTKPTPVSRLAPAPMATPAPPSATLPNLNNRIVPLISSSTATSALAPATVAVVAADTASHHHIEADSTTALEAGGNIILNVDSADFQLIADAKNENGQETNYVLVSDGSGGVQLIKENDFRLLEEARATTNPSHYIVNVPNEENFANFDLLANTAGTNGEQFAYIQLDSENFTALQFIQDGSATLEDPITAAVAAAAAAADKQKLVATADKNVTIGGTNYVIAADPSTDLNHIGKELSDFLHIDYGNLLKNDHQHEQT